MPRNLWTDEERSTLTTLWPDTPRPEIEKRLPGRTWDSIVDYAHNHKLPPRLQGVGQLKFFTQPIIDPADLNYIAGLFDGEGSITIEKTFSKRRNQVEVRPRVCIVNSHLPTLTWVQRVIGFGTIRPLLARTNKPVYQWFVDPINGVITVLETLLPSLRIKENEAKIMLKWCRLRLHQIHGTKIEESQLDKLRLNLSKGHKRNGQFRP